MGTACSAVAKICALERKVVQTQEESSEARQLHRRKTKESELMFHSAISSKLCEIDEIKREKERERRENEAEQQKLRADKHALENKLRVHKYQKVQLERRNQRLQKRLTETQAESGRFRRQFEERLTASQTESAALQETLTATQTESAALQERLTVSQTESAALQERLTASQTESAALQERLTATQTNLRAMQELSTNLQGVLTAIETNSEAQQERLTASETALGNVQERLTTSQTESAALLERLAASQTESDNIRQSLTAALAELQVVSQRNPQSVVISPWNVPRSEIHTSEEIGRGGWGVVLRGRYEGEEVAVKQPHRDLLNERLLQRLKRETRLMIHISHPNLVRIIAVVFDQAAESLRLPPLIVTELLDVNLRQCYQQRRLGAYNRIPVLLDAAKGLQHMHDCREPIIHRDVSAPNVLLKALPNGRWKAKVSDFGSANLARLSVTAGEGAIIYAAPEAFPVRDPSSPRPVHTTKIDVFSFGILMCEVVTEQQPDPDLHQERLQQVQRLSRPLQGLIVRCTNHNPDQRPSMATVIQELNRISLP